MLAGILLILKAPTLVRTVGGETVRLLEGAKMDFLAGLTFPIKTDGLDLDDVIRLFLQVPKNTRATGGVDLPNESLHVSILPLVITKTIESNKID